MVGAMIDSLLRLAKMDRSVLIISIDDYELSKSFSVLGDQYLCIGIQECNMIGIAAGMASCKRKIIAIGGGTFIAFRALEFIRNEICLQHFPVMLIGIGAGMAISYLGSTHHCTEDIGVLSSIPELTVFNPRDLEDTKKCIKTAYELNSPTYIRIGRHIDDGELLKKVSTDYCDIDLLREGSEGLIISSGSIVYDVVKVCDELNNRGIYLGIAAVRILNPLNKDDLKILARRYDRWICVEEHNEYSGIGKNISDVIVEEKIPVSLYKIGLTCFSKGHGNYDDLKRKNGLSVDCIAEKCLQAIRK